MDELRERIARAIIGAAGTNGPSEGTLLSARRQADRVIKELELAEIYSPVVVSDDGYTWPHFNEWYDDREQAKKAVASELGTQLGGAYITPWTLT